MKVINSEKAPLAIGPYSQAIIVNGFVFCSGQVGFNRKKDAFETGVEKQAHQAIKNLQEVLKAAGSSLDNVVKTTLFLKDMNDFAKVNEVYAGYFVKQKPARSTVEAARLPKDALFEIDCIAVVK